MPLDDGVPRLPHKMPNAHRHQFYGHFSSTIWVNWYQKNSHQRIVDSNRAGETTDKSDVEFKFYWETNDKHRYLSIHVFLQNGSVDTCQSELVCASDSLATYGAIEMCFD